MFFVFNLFGARMSAPYSLDLRRRAVSFYEENEETQQEVAQQFWIGLRTLKEWLFIKKETGDVQPKEHIHRGRLPFIDDKGLLFIKGLVENKPDILITEIQMLYAKKFKHVVSQSMISRAFKELNLRRKKKSAYASEQEREDVKKKEKSGKKK
jgi:transposase